MATPTPTLSGSISFFTLSGINDLDAILNGDKTKWGDSGTKAATVTYSFPNAGSAWMSDYGNEVTATKFLALTADQQTAARGAFSTWSDVANISFTEVTESSDSVGDIRIGFSSAVGDEAWGYAYYPAAEAYAGDIWINRTTTASATFIPGDYDYEALIHEMGHAIGLKHPGNYNAGGGGSEGPYITKLLDKTNFTIMSYTEPDWGGISPMTPGVYDILALQYLYGANTTTNVSDTTYTYTPGNLVGESIWDAGGTDTIDASAFSTAVTLDLQEGRYSDIGLSENIGIAFDVVIENAKGGNGADKLIGNAVANTLTGGADKDSFVFIKTPSASNIDTITDFVSGTDRIYLTSDAFATLSKSTDLASAFVSGDGATAVDSSNRLIYDTSTGILYYDADGSGSDSAVQFALLTGAPTLVATDFDITGTGGGSSDDNSMGDPTQTVLYDGNLEEGDDGKNTLSGSDGNDELFGLGGNDTLDGGDGKDYMDGGHGNDKIDGGDGEDIVWAGAGNDTIDGGNGDDEIATEDGNDSVRAGEGDDYVDSGDGNDAVDGGDGDDMLLGFTGNDKLTGGDGDDYLAGEEGADQLTGGTGDDYLEGGAGADKMAGGAGDDVYFVDTKSDKITESTNSGTDSVVTSIDYTLGSNLDDLYLYSEEGDALKGTGNKLDNQIFGDSQDDTIDGKEGSDTLEGGEGSDVFVFSTKLSASTNVDTISDFIHGEDTIYLSKKIFTGISSGEVADSNVIDFDSTEDSVTDANSGGERFLYDWATGDLYFDKDGSGKGVAVKFLTLTGVTEIAADALFIY